MSHTWSREHSFCFPTAMRGISDQFKPWLCSFSQTANFKVSVDRICGTPLATPVTQRVFMTDGAAHAVLVVTQSACNIKYSCSSLVPNRLRRFRMWRNLSSLSRNSDSANWPGYEAALVELWRRYHTFHQGALNQKILYQVLRDFCRHAPLKVGANFSSGLSLSSAAADDRKHFRA